MRVNILRWLFGFGAVAVPLVGIAAAVTPGCEEPLIDCRASRGDFAAKYTKISGDADCGGFETSGGEVVSLESFYPSLAGQQTQDYSQVFLTIGSSALGSLRDTAGEFGVPDPSHTVYAKGFFQSVQPSNDVCVVPTMDTAEQHIAEIPPEGTGGAAGAGGAGGAAGAGGMAGGAGGMAGAAGSMAGAAGMGACPMDEGGGEPPPFPGEPDTDVKYVWSNVKVHVSAKYEGTQWHATLNYSENIGGTACSAVYDVQALWPVVDCMTYDDCGRPTGVPDDSACDPGHPEEGVPGGSGINRDYWNNGQGVKCDPKLFLCVPVAPADPIK